MKELNMYLPSRCFVSGLVQNIKGNYPCLIKVLIQSIDLLECICYVAHKTSTIHRLLLLGHLLINTHPTTKSINRKTPTPLIKQSLLLLPKPSSALLSAKWYKNIPWFLLPLSYFYLCKAVVNNTLAYKRINPSTDYLPKKCSQFIIIHLKLLIKNSTGL